MQTRSKQSEWKPSLSSCCRIKQKELLTFCRLWESISASVQSNWSFQAENNEWMWDAAWLSPSLGGGSLSPPWKTPWTGASIKSHQLFTVSTWSQRWRSQAEGLPSPPPEPTHHQTKTETAKKQPAFFPLLQPLDLVTPLHVQIAWEANLKKRGKKAISCMNHSTTNSQCVCLKRIQFCLRCPWWCSLSVAPPENLPVCACVSHHDLSCHHVHIFIFSPLGSLCFVLFCFVFSFLNVSHICIRRPASTLARQLDCTPDLHYPVRSSGRTPACRWEQRVGGEAGRKVRVQQLWIIDTGQDREFTGQPCQLMCGCICTWRSGPVVLNRHQAQGLMFCSLV